MSWLPKILYYFRVLLIPVKSHVLRSLQRGIIVFIWSDCRPRLAARVTYRSRMEGGLWIPDIQRYYQASQLTLLPKFYATEEVPLWVELEASEVLPPRVYNLLWLPREDRNTISNPLTQHSLGIWDEARRRGNFAISTQSIVTGVT